MNSFFALLSTLIIFCCSQLNGGYGFMSIHEGHDNGDCDKAHEGQYIPTSNPCEFCECRKQILESFPIQIRYKIICNIQDCAAPGPGFCHEEGECCPSPPPCSTDCDEAHVGQQIPTSDPCELCVCSKQFLRSFPVQIRYKIICNIRDCPAPGPGFCREEGECCASPPPCSTGHSGKRNIDSKNGWRYIGQNYGYENNGNNNGNGNIGSNNGNRNIGSNNGNGNMGSNNGNDNIGRNNGNGNIGTSNGNGNIGHSGKRNIDSKNGWRYIGNNYGYENNGNNNGNGNIGSNNGNRNTGSNNGNGNMGSNNGNDNIGRNNGNGNIGFSNGNGNIGSAHGPWYGGYGGYNDRYGGYGGYGHKGIASCLRDNYYNYGNFFLSGEENHQPTILHCQKQCAAHPNCSLWTYGKKGGRLSQQCYLKHSASGDERYDPALIEGPKNCTPNMYDDKQFNPIMITNTGCTGLSKKQCKKNAKCNWVKYFRFGVKGMTCSWKRE